MYETTDPQQYSEIDYAGVWNPSIPYKPGKYNPQQNPPTRYLGSSDIVSCSAGSNSDPDSDESRLDVWIPEPAKNSTSFSRPQCDRLDLDDLCPSALYNQGQRGPTQHHNDYSTSETHNFGHDASKQLPYRYDLDDLSPTAIYNRQNNFSRCHPVSYPPVDLSLKSMPNVDGNYGEQFPDEDQTDYNNPSAMYNVPPSISEQHPESHMKNSALMHSSDDSVFSPYPGGNLSLAPNGVSRSYGSPPVPSNSVYFPYTDGMPPAAPNSVYCLYPDPSPLLASNMPLYPVYDASGNFTATPNSWTPHNMPNWQENVKLKRSCKEMLTLGCSPSFSGHTVPGTRTDLRALRLQCHNAPLTRKSRILTSKSTDASSSAEKIKKRVSCMIEKKRVQNVNYAFQVLKRYLPVDKYRHVKMSKLKILQFAMEHIQELTNYLINIDDNSKQPRNNYSTSSCRFADDIRQGL